MKPTIFLLALALFAADDPWTKVRELKSGTELRIYKRNAKQPLLAKMDQATEESLVIVVKNEQVAVPKEEIDRVDHRPAGGSRVTRESTTKTNTVANRGQSGNPGINDENEQRSKPFAGPTATRWKCCFTVILIVNKLLHRLKT
jgi:hypothetical protein